MQFCTVVNCMDGRVQLPVISYLKKRFSAEYVDAITEAGPNRILAEEAPYGNLESIYKRLDISVFKHGSGGIAVVGHHDCAGNPEHKDVQIEHVRKAITVLERKYKNIDIIGLWVDENWTVHDIKEDEIIQ